MAGRSIVKRKPGLVNSAKQVASDLGYGLSELKRQAQGAANTIKQGAKKIKQFTK